MEQESEIASFYAGKNVFLTGGSGFLGKVIIEKLLRCCPKVQHVFVLIRPKNGKSGQHRLESMLKSVVFDRVRNEQTKQLEKVRSIGGDISFSELGISFDELIVLIDQVNVVIHSAATIRFDEPLRRAININVRGTEQVMRFCNKLKNLQALVHVSTSYCNIVRQGIEEKVYEEDVSVSNLLQAAEWMDDDLMEEFAKRYYKGRPSSYHYTKAMAERYLAEQAQKSRTSFEIAIVRPSIVTPSLADPMPGWTDNYYGPTGYFVVTGNGVLRSMLVDKDKLCDIIPVDIVANTVLCAAKFICSKQNPVKQMSFQVDLSGHGFIEHERLTIFNCVSCTLNPISWGKINELSQPLLLKYPSKQLFRYPGTLFHSNRLLHTLIVSIEHKLPAMFVDFLFKMTGNGPILTPVYDKIHRATNALEFFTLNEWTWKTTNYEQLINSLNESDRQNFFIDVRKVNWSDYMKAYILGVRQYLLREDPKTIPAARVKLNRIYYLTQMVKLLLATGGLYQAIKLYSLLRSFRSKANMLKAK